MGDIHVLPLLQKSETPQDAFERWARPLTSKLLKAVELDVRYRDGLGDWVEAEIAGTRKRVLDMAGGYGANLFGHKNPLLLETARSLLDVGSPAQVQGSRRNEAGELAQKLSELLQNEVGEGPWITTLSNSGTESVEAALKFALLNYTRRMGDLELELRKSSNELRLHLETLSQVEQNHLFRDWRKHLIAINNDLLADHNRKDWLLHMTMQCHDIASLMSLMDEFNRLQLSLRPRTASLEKAYHGKTLGALSLTHKETYRAPFYVDERDTVFLKPSVDIESLNEFFNTNRFSTLCYGIHSKGPYIEITNTSLLTGVFVEPIQGEAGVLPLPNGFLPLLKKFSLQHQFLLIFDEIQAGMYRTGKLASGSHTHVSADIYCFSKALGGGIAKIGATSILAKKYIDDFGFLHTSTFADDGFSAAVALQALSIIHEGDLLERGMITGQLIQQDLQDLAEEFPDVIGTVRGQGLMLALEFSPCLRDLSFEFLVFCENKMIGYLMAGALLHNESIRMTPSLSNGFTLRIAPSLYAGHEERIFLIDGLKRLCQAVRRKDLHYFFQHLYPNTPLSQMESPVFHTAYTPKQRPLAVFLCHLIDGEHIKKVSPMFAPIEDKALEDRMGLMRKAMDFQVYHAQVLKDANGNEIDIIMMGLAVTSSDLKKAFLSKERSSLIGKVQAAVAYAKELGASTVGLGQFTSIVTGNGLYLDPMGMNLTTGNAFTIALAVQAAVRSAQQRGIQLENSHAALIGAAGNIISVASSLLADQVARLTLIHHSPLNKSAKMVGAVRTILQDIQKSQTNNILALKVRQSLHNTDLSDDQQIVQWCERSDVREYFCVDHELDAIKDADVVVTGASSGNGFLTAEHFKTNAVVVDVAVPANIQPEQLERLRSERPDITYLMGGIAKLPHEQTIYSPLFPLTKGESYACMAETFALCFSGKKDIRHIGNLNKDMVRKVEGYAQSAGLELGGIKEKNSL